jgi:hypothetical protein
MVEIVQTSGNEDKEYGGFYAGQDVIIGKNTPHNETNTIMALIDYEGLRRRRSATDMITMVFVAPLQNNHAAGHVYVEGIPGSGLASASDESEANLDTLPLILSLAVPGVVFLLAVIATYNFRGGSPYNPLDPGMYRDNKI